MRVISKKRLDDFIRQYPNSKNSLESWHVITKNAAWKSFADVKQVYGSADLVGRRTVFNISGNHYRLIARINYNLQIVFILHILTHTEYDKGDWKK